MSLSIGGSNTTASQPGPALTSQTTAAAEAGFVLNNPSDWRVIFVYVCFALGALAIIISVVIVIFIIVRKRHLKIQEEKAQQRLAHLQKYHIRGNSITSTTLAKPENSFVRPPPEVSAFDMPDYDVYLGNRKFTSPENSTDSGGGPSVTESHLANEEDNDFEIPVRLHRGSPLTAINAIYSSNTQIDQTMFTHAQPAVSIPAMNSGKSYQHSLPLGGSFRSSPRSHRNNNLSWTTHSRPDAVAQVHSGMYGQSGTGSSFSTNRQNGVINSGFIPEEGGSPAHFSSSNWLRARREKFSVEKLGVAKQPAGHGGIAPRRAGHDGIYYVTGSTGSGNELSRTSSEPVVTFEYFTYKKRDKLNGIPNGHIPRENHNNSILAKH